MHPDVRKAHPRPTVLDGTATSYSTPIDHVATPWKPKQKPGSMNPISPISLAEERVISVATFVDEFTPPTAEDGDGVLLYSSVNAILRIPMLVLQRLLKSYGSKLSSS